MKKTILCFLLIVCCGCSSNKQTKSQEANHGECYLIPDSNASLCVGLDDTNQKVTYLRVIVVYDSYIISTLANSEDANEMETFLIDTIKQNMEFKQQDETEGILDYWDIDKEENLVKPVFSSHYDVDNENEISQSYYYQEIVYFNFLNKEFNFQDEKIKQRLDRIGLTNVYSESEHAIMYKDLKESSEFKYHYLFEIGTKVNTPEDFNPHI